MLTCRAYKHAIYVYILICTQMYILYMQDLQTTIYVYMCPHTYRRGLKHTNTLYSIQCYTCKASKLIHSSSSPLGCDLNA